MSSPNSATPHATETPELVLVVENDPLVRLGTVVMLRELGLAPVAANDGAAALATIAGGIMPTLLITDYDMPGMNGVALGHEVCAANPAAQVLIVTGHSAIDEPLADGWKLLAKPFTSDELRDALADLASMRRGVAQPD